MPDVVDHPYCHMAGYWFRKWSRGVVVKGLKGFLIDFGFEGGLERFVRVVCAEEIGVAPEPHVDSRTISPGSVVIRIQRSIVGSVFRTTNFLLQRN